MRKRVDDLGRIVIPKGIREQLNIDFGTSVDIEVVDNKAIITNSKKNDCIEKAIQYIENFGMDANGFDDMSSYYVEDLYKILKGE